MKIGFGDRSPSVPETTTNKWHEYNKLCSVVASKQSIMLDKLPPNNKWIVYFENKAIREFRVIFPVLSLSLSAPLCFSRCVCARTPGKQHVSRCLTHFCSLLLVSNKTFQLVLNDHYVLSSFMFYITSLLNLPAIHLNFTLRNDIIRRQWIQIRERERKKKSAFISGIVQNGRNSNASKWF